MSVPPIEDKVEEPVTENEFKSQFNAFKNKGTAIIRGSSRVLSGFKRKFQELIQKSAAPLPSVKELGMKHRKANPIVSKAVTAAEQMDNDVE